MYQHENRHVGSTVLIKDYKCIKNITAYKLRNEKERRGSGFSESIYLGYVIQNWNQLYSNASLQFASH